MQRLTLNRLRLARRGKDKRNIVEKEVEILKTSVKLHGKWPRERDKNSALSLPWNSVQQQSMEASATFALTVKLASRSQACSGQGKAWYNAIHRVVPVECLVTQ